VGLRAAEHRDSSRKTTGLGVQAVAGFSAGPSMLGQSQTTDNQDRPGLAGTDQAGQHLSRHTDHPAFFECLCWQLLPVLHCRFAPSLIQPLPSRAFPPEPLLLQLTTFFFSLSPPPRPPCVLHPLQFSLQPTRSLLSRPALLLVPFCGLPSLLFGPAVHSFTTKTLSFFLNSPLQIFEYLALSPSSPYLFCLSLKNRLKTIESTRLVCLIFTIPQQPLLLIFILPSPIPESIRDTPRYNSAIITIGSTCDCISLACWKTSGRSFNLQK
jgi:hypothetical protein